MVQTAPKPGKTTEEELASRIATAQAEATELVKAKWRNMAIEQRWDLGVTLFGLTTAAIVISPASGLLQSGYRSLAALPQKVEQAKEAASETVEEVKTGAINFGLIGGRFKGTPPKGEKIAGYTVTSSWGPRNIPNGSRYHRGVDLATHALQATVKRVDFAYQRFFKGLGGYPKFKSIRHYSGWTYPCKSGWKALTDGKNGSLKITNLGTIRMRGQARTWGTPKTCTLFLRNRKWYASITVDCIPQRATGTGAIGIDFGVLTAVALSDGTKIEAPRFARNAQISKLQKKLRRKKKFSRAWKKGQNRIRTAHRKVANQRQNWSHQVAAQIVSCHSLVATEKLNVKGMTRSGKSHDCSG